MESICSNCLSQSIRIDFSEGVRVCCTCGLILERNFIDISSEERNIDDSSKRRCDFISREEFNSDSMTRKKNKEKYAGMKEIESAAHYLELIGKVIPRAINIWATILKSQTYKINKSKLNFPLACLWLACCQDHQYTALKAIECFSGETSENFFKVVKMCKKELPSEPLINLEEYFTSFSGRIEMSLQQKEEAINLIKIIKEKGISSGRKVKTIAAAVIFVVLCKDKVDLGIVELICNTMDVKEKYFKSSIEYLKEIMRVRL